MKSLKHYSDNSVAENSALAAEMAENFWNKLLNIGIRRQLKMHILTMFLYKFISDTTKSSTNEPRGNRSCFNVSAKNSFQELIQFREKRDLGKYIDSFLAQIEQESQSKFNGLLKQYRFVDSRVLGDLPERDQILQELIDLFASIDLSIPSIAARCFGYLLEKFAIEGGKVGEDFQTPESLCRLMALLLPSTAGNTVYDPACGSGSLLVSFAKESGSPKSEIKLFGQERNFDVYNMARMNMLIHGLEDAQLEWGDSLNIPQFVQGNPTSLQKFDIIVSNPPISMDNWRHAGFDMEKDKFGRFTWGVPPDSKGDFAFISHMLASASDRDAKVGIITSHGTLFRGGVEQKIRQGIIENNYLDAVIGLPGNLLDYTSIPVVILLFKKIRKMGDNVLFIDCSQEFNTTGRRYSLKPEGIQRAVSAYLNFSKNELGAVEAEGFSRVVGIEEIRNNDFNLNIARYVGPVTSTIEIDVEKLKEEVRNKDGQIREINEQMKAGLKELGL